jgi:hypothetical protein
MTAGSTTRIAVSLALIAGAAAYAVMGAIQRSGVPDEASWDQAAQVVREGWQDGDLIVFAPAWAHAGAPRFQGLHADIAELPDWYEAAKHPRVWVVAQAPHREPVPPYGWQALARTETGGMTVHLWTPPADQPLVWDGLASIRDAKVAHGDGPARQECTTWQNNRWSCGAAHPWQNVGRVSRDIQGRERTVIWAHGRDNGDPLEIRWPGVPAGRTLTIHVGLTQRAIEQAAGAPVVFEVRVGDRVVVQRTLGFNEGGWFRHDVDVTGQGALDVTVRIVTKSNPFRQLCFTADVWG